MLENLTYSDRNSKLRNTPLRGTQNRITSLDGDHKNSYYDSLRACESSLGERTFFLETGGLRITGFSTGVGLGVRAGCVAATDGGGDATGSGGGGVAGRGGSGGGGREGGGGGGATALTGCIMEATASDTSSTIILAGSVTGVVG